MARILGDGTRQRTRAFTHLQSHYLCEHMPGRISSTALVRYRLVDYSAPAVHAHKKVTVKGYVDRVEIALGADIVARHRRSYVRGDVVYDPLH